MVPDIKQNGLTKNILNKAINYQIELVLANNDH